MKMILELDLIVGGEDEGCEMMECHHEEHHEEHHHEEHHHDHMMKKIHLIEEIAMDIIEEFIPDVEI